MSESIAAPIEIRNLSKVFHLGFWKRKRVHALRELTLCVQPGQIFGLLGPNGAGKSTTIKVLMNLIQPTSGTALLFGEKPRRIEARRGVGFVPENPAPYEYLTGYEFISLAGRLAGLSGQALHRRVGAVLGQVELDHAKRMQIRGYSKGMVQRVALAQALIAQPRLLILDEPTSGLDPLGRRLIRDLILSEKEKKTAVLFCTHIIPDVEAVCDRVAVLVSGKLVREGSVREMVTSTAESMEVVIEGISRPQLEAFGIPLESVQEPEHRLLTRLASKHVEDLLRAVLAQGGRIARLQPSRFSLEDVFMKALKEAGPRSVGGDIS